MHAQSPAAAFWGNHTYVHKQVCTCRWGTCGCTSTGVHRCTLGKIFTKIRAMSPLPTSMSLLVSLPPQWCWASPCDLMPGRKQHVRAGRVWEGGSTQTCPCSLRPPRGPAPSSQGDRLSQAGDPDKPSPDINCHHQTCERCLCRPPPAEPPVATDTRAGSAGFSHVDKNSLLPNSQNYEQLQLLQAEFWVPCYAAQGNRYERSLMGTFGRTPHFACACLSAQARKGELAHTLCACINNTQTCLPHVVQHTHTFGYTHVLAHLDKGLYTLWTSEWPWAKPPLPSRNPAGRGKAVVLGTISM